MSNKTKACYDLLEIIEKQKDVIAKQNTTIVKLVNENMEKENMINVLMQEQEHLY